MSYQIVLLSGAQGAGKTTTQNAIIKAWHMRRDHRAVAVNFADPLYEMHDFVRNIAERYGIPKKMPKDGPLLQLLGTEWGRKTIDENIWVECLKGRIKHIQVTQGLFAFGHPLVVVGDCRFKNEFDAFPEALRVRLECSEEIRKTRCSMWRENTQHPSEIDLDSYRNKFDIMFDTNMFETEDIVQAILEILTENIWKERRYDQAW